MPIIRVSESATIPATPRIVYDIIADYRAGHPAILPRPPFQELVVEKGGVGAGTVIRFGMRIGGRARVIRARIEEPEPGRVLVEREIDGGGVTTFIVDPAAAGSTVTFITEWTRGGFAGWMEALLAPPMLRKVYRAELANLARRASTG